MIQRKQSLYLLLMTLTCLWMMAGNLTLYKGSLNINGAGVSNYAIHVKNTTIDNPKTVITTSNLVYGLTISALVSVISIFLYKRRAVQLRLTAFNFLFLGISLFFMIYNYYQLKNLKDVSIQSTEYQFALILPVLLLVLNVLAFRGIKKDMDLLASVDRLR